MADGVWSGSSTNRDCFLTDDSYPEHWAQCSGYESSVKKQSRLVDDPDQTPSAMMLGELSEKKMTFSDYILDLSKQNKGYFKGLMDLSSSKNALFEKEAKDSIKKQSDIESEEREPFSDHLKKYFES